MVPMEKKEEPKPSIEQDDYHPNYDDGFQELLQTLEQQVDWDGRTLLKYQGHWYPSDVLQRVLSFQKCFGARKTDIILASMPKAGTTWLKALVFSIANRKVFPVDHSPLLNSNPHKLVPFLESPTSWICQENRNPRIFSTHLPWEILPTSLIESGCKVICICRNPLDLFVSFRYFQVDNKMVQKVGSGHELDTAFDLFCKGVYPSGPFWDHVLGYWNAHLEHPRNVLFLRYEDLKEDADCYVKRMAEFLEMPFSKEEEKHGLIQQISSLCSFEKLSSLEVNKVGSVDILDVTFKNSSFYRKGEVGDWANYLTPAMAERVDNLLKNKLEGSGLTFEFKI